MSGPGFLVIGAGSRGHAYAQAVTKATCGHIAAVAEIDAFKRREFGKAYIWHDERPKSSQEFVSWQDWIDWELGRRAANMTDEPSEAISGVFICTLDETHAEIIRCMAPFNLHIMCEKPLALSLADCLSIKQALQPGDGPPVMSTAHLNGYHARKSSNFPKIFSIGHVLRYSPHNELLRKLLLHDRVIGEVVSIEHTEPIGWWHFSHSYVRGNWRRTTSDGVGSLLTKSCHDIDFLLWLLCSPANAEEQNAPHLPSTISSTGHLTHFRQARKPKKAGVSTNCLSCPAETDCIYSAKKIYRDRWLKEKQDTGWPLKIVVPEIEDIVLARGWDAAEQRLMEKLGEDYRKHEVSDDYVSSRGWYGRCVYESDNDVCDEQIVTMSWEADPDAERGPKTAILHMTYPTQAQCQRRGRVYGELGEITYDSNVITVHKFANGETRTHVIPKQAPEVEKSHGGGDWGLASAFVDAVDASERAIVSVEEAQKRFIGADLDEMIRSHAVVFAAEEARIAKSVIDFPRWWKSKLLSYIGTGPSC